MPNRISYTRVGDDVDAKSRESLLEHDVRSERKICSESRILWTYVFTAIIVFIAAFVILANYAWRVGQNVCVLGNKMIFDDVPIIYEYQRFKRAGFHDRNHEDHTIYEGKPNEKNNAAWERLLQVGVVAISREESDRLVNSTTMTPANPSEYMVELEIFHQLHCLKWLRDQLWELEEVVSGTKSLEKISQRMDHNDHCVDYLLQAIVCRCDMTPITFEWNIEINQYLAYHSTEHQCRNFDRIFDWAKGRARTGLMADGAHQNVELENPETYD